MTSCRVDLGGIRGEAEQSTAYVFRLNGTENDGFEVLETLSRQSEDCKFVGTVGGKGNGIQGGKYSANKIRSKGNKTH